MDTHAHLKLPTVTTHSWETQVTQPDHTTLSQPITKAQEVVYLSISFTHAFSLSTFYTSDQSLNLLYPDMLTTENNVKIHYSLTWGYF